MQILIAHCDKCGEEKEVVEIGEPDSVTAWYLCQKCLRKILGKINIDII